MGRLDDDIPDRIEDITDDVLDVIDDASDGLNEYEDAWDQLETNLTRINTKEVARLYADEEIPPETAREWEEMVDLKYRMAGEEPFFENLPDEQRPSNMYDYDPTKPQSLFERIGYTVDKII